MNLRKEYITRVTTAIKLWDNQHPIDVWWRDFFKIPFLSSKHLESNFITQQAWYEEQKYVQEVMEKHKNRVTDDIYIGEDEKMTQDEIDDSFDKIEVTAFDSTENGEVEKEDGEVENENRERQYKTLQTLIENSKTNG